MEHTDLANESGQQQAAYKEDVSTRELLYEELFPKPERHQSRSDKGDFEKLSFYKPVKIKYYYL